MFKSLHPWEDGGCQELWADGWALSFNDTEFQLHRKKLVLEMRVGDGLQYNVIDDIYCTLKNSGNGTFCFPKEI